MKAPSPLRKPPRLGQQGFSLLETFIGISIGLFILAGMVSVFGSTIRVFAQQMSVGQWQDSSRTAMQMLTTVIEHAGYYAFPEQRGVGTAFPKSSTYAMDVGQFVSGSTDSTSKNDTLTVRYSVSPSGQSNSDFLEDCAGAVNGTSGGMHTVANTFSLNTSNELVCAVDGGTSKALASGITRFNVMYGVDLDGDGSANAYFPADQMNTWWSAVVSVQVILVFQNPLDAAQTITTTRVINLMSHA